MASRHRSSLRSLAKIAKAVRLRRCPFLANGGLLLLVVLLGCGTSHQATSPDATPAVGVNGIVRAERPPGRYSMPPPLEPGVQVAVISGPAQGSMVMTDANGAYSLQIPPGTFKLRASKAGFLPVEGAEQILDAGDHITLPDIVLKTAPWAISGTVTDSRANRVADVLVTIELGGTFFNTLSTTSAADGRYRIASTTAHFDTVELSARKNGFESLSRQQVSCCDPPADNLFDITLVRVLKVTMTGPSTLRVGEGVELPLAGIDLDNGAQRLVYILPSSSDPTAVAVEHGQRGFVIRGVRPGVATITFDYQGAGTTLQVRVVDQ
jgi:hypothetical protein